MFKKIAFLSVAAVFIISLNGCASLRRQQEFEIQGLRNQVSLLEAQVRLKDDEITVLRESFVKAQTEKEGRPLVNKLPETKSRPKARQIQAALANAGYNPGTIDGKMGKQTRQAIRAFQRANNLKVDGKVGKETWGLLKEYLYKKAK